MAGRVEQRGDLVAAEVRGEEDEAFAMGPGLFDMLPAMAGPNPFQGGGGGTKPDGESLEDTFAGFCGVGMGQLLVVAEGPGDTATGQVVTDAT